MTPLEWLLASLVVGLAMALWRQIEDAAKVRQALAEERVETARCHAVLDRIEETAKGRRQDGMAIVSVDIMGDAFQSVPRVGRTTAPRQDRMRCGLMGDPHLCQDEDGNYYRTDTGQGHTHSIYTPEAHPGN